MIILHASSSSGRLVLWGEASPETPEKPTPKPVRRNAQFRVQPSRFALAADRLEEVLAAPVTSFKAARDQKQQWTAWLPSSDAGALPSSPLLTEEPDEPAEAKLSPWKMPAIVLESEQAVSILLASMDKTTWAPGVLIGKTLAYWASVLRFAGGLVARQQYLPGLDAAEDGGGFSARWEPIYIGQDRIAAERLARSMPHACRALGLDEANPPQTAASAVLFPVVAMLVDHLARTAVARPGKSAGSFASQHDRWVHALHSEDGVMNADPGELARLAEQVRQWRRPIEVAASAPFRLCLRLEEPKPGARASSTSGVSAICCRQWTTRACWSPSRRPGRHAGMKPLYSTATVSSRASTCFPLWGRRRPSARGSRTASSRRRRRDTPSTRAVRTSSSRNAPRRLNRRDSACSSRRGGRARVLTCGLSARAVVSAGKPKMKSKSILSLDEILNFHWEVSLGDEKLTYEELQALAELKSPLVNVRGKWVTLSAEEINAALEFWKKKGDAPITRARR